MFLKFYILRTAFRCSLPRPMAMDGADSMLEIQLWHIADAVKLT